MATNLTLLSPTSFGREAATPLLAVGLLMLHRRD